MDAAIFMQVVAGLFGLIIGSFLNVVIWRLPENEGIVTSRSRCRACAKTLAWYELIPVISFAIQQGRCRSCRAALSLQYPLVELACALLFVAVWRHLFIGSAGTELTASPQLIIPLLYLFFAVCALIVIFVTDLRHFLIPDAIVYPAIVISALFTVLNKAVDCQWLMVNCSLVDVALSLGGSAFFLALVLVSRGAWMGLGDVKLAAFMGLFLGPAKLLTALLLAFFAGSIIGLALIGLRRKTLKSEVPFGAFLVPAALTVFFGGDAIMNVFSTFMLLKP